MSDEQSRADLIQALSRLTTLPPNAGLPSQEKADLTEQESAFYRVETGSVAWVFPGGVRAEALADPSIAPLPNASELLLGIINVRGDLVPVYQLHSLLGEALASAAVVMVFSTDAGRVGLLVDRLPIRCSFRIRERIVSRDSVLPDALEAAIDGSFIQDSHTHHCLNIEKLTDVLLKLASEGAASREPISTTKNTYPPLGAMS